MADRKTNGPFAFHTDVWPGVAKLIEECGELQQVLGKLVMIGGGSEHWDGSNLHRRLEEELADVAAAIWVLQALNPQLSMTTINNRILRKHNLFMHWHEEGEE